MKIKAFKLGLCLLAITFAFISCGDDDDDTIEAIPLRDRAEQQLADKDSLLTYLSTHYYNSSFFENEDDHRYTDIIITELPVDDDTGEYLDMPDPDNNTLLINAVETVSIEYLEVDYEYYILRLNQGEGEAPKFTDQVRVSYEGSEVESGDIFDSRITPEDLFLQGDFFNTFGTIKAWQLVMPTFNTSSGFNLNNGVVNYTDYGLGVMFIPSGLAYFAGTNSGSSYANLIFKFELLSFEEEDHDNDGIPSYIEDLNGDLEVSDDDTDDNDFPNFIDLDDDGDGVLTINELVEDTRMFYEGEPEPVLDINEYEIRREVNSGAITITTVTAVDANNNGILDYLDDTVTTNYNEDETN